MMGPFDLRIQSRFDDGMISILTGISEPIAYTKAEGGEWNAIPDDRVVTSPAAILYSDGAVYDFVLPKHGMSPWRQLLKESRPRIRVPMGRAIQ